MKNRMVYKKEEFLMMFFIKKRKFIVEEKDIATILSVVNREARVTHYRIGNCGWANNPNKWFVSFYTTDKRYGKVMKFLTKDGNFTAQTIPDGQVDLWFEKT